MRLDLEQIKRITVGAVRIREDADGFHFSKLSERQEAVFCSLSENFKNGARATTGIRLEFYTDSSLVKYATLKNGVCQEEVLTFPSSSGEKRENKICILLSFHAYTSVSYIELSEGAYIRPLDYKQKMLFFGDSITQGWHSSRDEYSFAYLTSLHFSANSIIQGVGGAYYHPSLAERLDFDPDTVIVAYGTNDASRAQSVDEVRTNCAEFLSRICTYYPNAAIRVITPIWRTDYDQLRPYGHVQLIGDCIRTEAERLNIPVIDGMKLLPRDPSFLADTVHPNDKGFERYAKELIRALEGFI